MQKHTLSTIQGWLNSLNSLGANLADTVGNRVPKPFPGNTYPTRVAWKFEFEGNLRVRHHLSYIGKPCAYRATQAQQILKGIKTCNALHSAWAVEFDQAGIVAYKYYGNGTTSHVNAYFAYHPQGGAVDPIGAFTKPIYIKRIGKFPTYSHQKKISADQVESYYRWWSTHFDPSAKLKRPRKKAVAKSAPDPIPAPDLEYLNVIAQPLDFAYEPQQPDLEVIRRFVEWADGTTEPPLASPTPRPTDNNFVRLNGAAWYFNSATVRYDIPTQSFQRREF